jgi:hypothetical protein
MAATKRSSPQHITPMPFPGESPTISLALAAAQKYGLHAEESAKPARSPKAKAKTKRKAPAKPTAAKAGSARKPKRSSR